MSPTAKRIEIEVVGDVKNFQNSLGKAAGSADSFGSSLTKMAKYGALAIGAAGIGGLAVVLRSGIKEFAEASKVGAQTGAVLKSTGGAANVTAGQVSNLADSLMRKSGVDDEAIQSGENMLLTFTRIRNEVGQGNDIFDQATKATLNLSVAMGKDMSSSAILVGKALNDPLKGMTALNKAGIQFTQSQKDSIKAMVEAGNTMGAQKMILKELETQFGGSAEAIGKTLPGQINILKESFSNMAGEMVSALVPAFSQVMASVSGFVQRLGEAEGARAKLDVVWSAITSGVTQLVGAIRDAFNRIDWGAVGQTLSDGLRRALAFLGSIDYGGILLNVATKVLNALKAAFNAIDWGAVGNAVGTALVKALNKIAEFVKSVDWNNVGQQLVHGIGVTIKALATFLAGVNWASVLGALTKGIIAVLKGLAGLLLGIATAIGAAIIAGISAGAKSLWGQFSAWLSGIPGRVQGAVGDLSATLWNAGTAILQGLWDGLKSKWEAVAGWLGGLGGKIADLKGPESKDATLLTPHGKAIILGLETGMMASWATLAPKINALGGQIIHNFILGISAAQPAFTGKMAQAATAALDAARAVVEAAQGKFADAFGKLGDMAKRAFEAKTQGMLDKLTAEFDRKVGAINAFKDSLTPAELALRQLNETEATLSRQAALDAANAAMVKAQAMDAGIEKEQAVAAASEQIRQANLANTRVALEAQAAVERTQRDQAAALQIAFLEETKAREATNLEERRAQLAAKLDEQLAVLVEKLAKHPQEYDKTMQAIAKLLKGYGITMKNAGTHLGDSFAAGIRASYKNVEAAAKKLAQIVADYVPHSPAKKGPLSKPPGWSDYLTAGFPRALNLAAGAAAAGGARPAASMAMAGTGGGGYSGGGGNTYNFSFPHYVGNRRELVDAVRSEVQRTIARNK